MKLIVGLGNPGRKYVGTRHNVGFRVVELLASRFADGRVRVRFEAETVEARVAGTPCLLMCPQTYMNASGRSVARARDFFKQETEQLLVVCDDFQLPLGKLRFRRGGTAGGQKGLHDILRSLGTQDVPRLRIGIGSPPPQWDVAAYVLSKFPADEVDVIEEAIQRAADAAETWVASGIETCMNQYNAG